MPIKIEIEGKGQVAEFPDGTDQKVIDAAVKRDFFGGGQPELDTHYVDPHEPKISSRTFLDEAKSTAIRLGEPAAEATGLAVGSILGGPPGAALGYGMVRQGEKLLFGKPPEKMTEQAIEAGVDVAEGYVSWALGGKPIEWAGKLISPVGKAVTSEIKNAIVPELEGYWKAAKKWAYNPLPTEVKGIRGKIVSSIENLLSNLPFSAGPIHRARIENLDKLVEIRNRIVDRSMDDKSVENLSNRIRTEAESIVKTALGRRADVSKAKIDTITSKLMSGLNAEMGATEREIGLSKALGDFYTQVGIVPEKFETGKTVQDMMASRKDAMFKDARADLVKAKQLLGSEVVETAEARGVADHLISEELKNPLSNPELIKTARKFASPQENLNAEDVGWLAKVEKSRPGAFKAYVEELPEDKTTWVGLDAAQSNLNDLIREYNALEGTVYAGTAGSQTKTGYKLTLLRNAINADMEAHAKDVNEQAYQIFKQGKYKWWQAEDMFDRDVLGIMKKNPEDVFKSIISKEEVTNIRKMKEILGEEGFDPFKKILSRQVIAIEPKTGVLDVAKTARNINTYGETFREVFSESERQGFLGLVRKGQEVNKQYDRSQAFHNVWRVSEGTLNTKATLDAVSKNKSKLLKHFTQDELDNISTSVSQIGRINLQDLARNNAAGLKFLNALATSDPLGKVDAVVDQIVRPNNTIRIKYAKRLLGPELTEEVTQEFLGRHLFRLNADTKFLEPKATRVMYEKYENTLKELIGDTKKWQEISDLLELTKHAVHLQSLAIPAARGGQTLLQFETYKRLTESAALLALGSLGLGTVAGQLSTSYLASGVAVAVLPRVVAKLYLSNAGRRLLSTGFTVPAGTVEGAKIIAALTSIAGLKKLSGEDQGQQRQSNQVPTP